MIRVKDDSDNIIQGLYKMDNGSIVVDRQSEYKKYMAEKKQVEKINELESTINSIKQDISETKELLLLLLKTKDNNGND